MIRAFLRNCGDRFHRWLDEVAPGDPSWASEPSTLDNLDRPYGEYGDIPAIRNGLGGLTGPHERDDRWLGLRPVSDERYGDGRQSMGGVR